MLEELFSSKTRARLLRTFFGNPGKSFYQSELREKDAISVIQYELAKLVHLKIIETFTVGNKRYYQVNMKNRVYNELKELIRMAG